MLHIHFTDEKITYVRVGVSVVDSEDLYEPTYRDLENVFRYIKGESRNDGTVQLMHAPTLERLDVDVESLLSSLEGLMQKKKSVGKILTTWSEKRHAQREKDINEIADEVDERHPDVKTSNGKKPARSLDAFLEGLDDMLDPPDSLPPAVRPLGD